ncbi:hypothetical protein PG989_016138 [Apiospora arundinis]
MIWEKYDNEVDPVIWHEFFYSHRPLRASTTNAKSDGLEGVQSYRVRRPGDGSATDVRHKKKNQSTALSPLAGVYLPPPSPRPRRWPRRWTTPGTSALPSAAGPRRLLLHHVRSM